MIVCICNNISDRNITKDIQKGLSFDQIIEKYGCDQCRKCNIHINELWEQDNEHNHQMDLQQV